jgi:hypothetical protein
VTKPWTCPRLGHRAGHPRPPHSPTIQIITFKPYVLKLITDYITYSIETYLLFGTSTLANATTTLCSRPHDDRPLRSRPPDDLRCNLFTDELTTTNFVKCFNIDVWLIYKQSFGRKIVRPKSCSAELSFGRKIVFLNNCSTERGLPERKYPTD